MIFTKGTHHSAKFETFDCSGEISPNLYFDRLLLLKVYKVSAKKKCGGVMSHDTKESWCAPHPLSAEGVEPPTKFSKRRGGLDRTSTFRGRLLGKSVVTFFRGGGELQFSHKK